VRYIEAKERNIPAFRTIQWAWFTVAMLSVYGETLRKFDYIIYLLLSTAYIDYMITYLVGICFYRFM